MSGVSCARGAECRPTYSRPRLICSSFLHDGLGLRERSDHVSAPRQRLRRELPEISQNGVERDRTLRTAAHELQPTRRHELLYRAVLLASRQTVLLCREFVRRRSEKHTLSLLSTSRSGDSIGAFVLRGFELSVSFRIFSTTSE